MAAHTRHPHSGGMARKGTLVLLCVLACAIVVFDQLAKACVREHLAYVGEMAPGIPGVFQFELVYNTGAAFGIFAGGDAVFVVIAVAIVIAVIVWAVLANRRPSCIVVTLALVAGGAIGNLIDRIVFGYVTDYISLSFIDFAVFNLADMCITVGCTAFVVLVFEGGWRDRGDTPSERLGGDACDTKATDGSCRSEGAAEECRPNCFADTGDGSGVAGNIGTVSDNG